MRARPRRFPPARQRWSRERIVDLLRKAVRATPRLNRGALRQRNPLLHSACVRLFGSLDRALQAAGISPASVPVESAWTDERVVTALRKAQRAGLSLRSRHVRDRDTRLWSAALRVFGSWRETLAVLGLPNPRRGGPARGERLPVDGR